MVNAGGYRTLIIDSEADPLSSQGPIPTTVVKTGAAAKSALTDPTQRYAAIFINPILCNPGGIRIISLAHRHRPATPIFILHDGELPFSPQELHRLAITGAIQKPLSPQWIAKRISQKIFSCKPSPSVSSLESSNTEYVAVPASDYMTGSPQTFDTYLKLPSGKFLRIAEAKESLTPQRVLDYMRKGAKYFYLSRQSHERCLTYCDVVAKFLIRQSSISLGMKVAEVYNEGQEIHGQIQEKGLDPEQLDMVFPFLFNIRTLLKELDLEDYDTVKRFLAHIPSYEHAVSTTMVASILSTELEIEADSAFRTIGTASLLHDIGLFRLPLSVQHEDESAMNEEEKRLYRTHPALGAGILSQIPSIESAIVQAVAQHHERRDNTGFPNRTPALEINRIAEIVGISDEFVRLIRRRIVEPKLDLLKAMEETAFPGFSFPVIDCFKKIFATHLKPFAATQNRRKARASKSPKKRKPSS